MQREISDRIFLGQTISPFDDIGNSFAIDRTASNYTDAKKKLEQNKRVYQHREI